MHAQRHTTNRTASPRRGIATLWLILSLPVFLTLFCFVVDIANIWLARIELKNALDATSLASVQIWGETSNPSDPSDTLYARSVGVEFAQANLVAGSPLVIGTNFLMGGVPNQNAFCNLADNANLIFGSVDLDDPDNIIFDAGLRPSCGAGTVFIEALKADSGNDASDRLFAVFYQDGDPNVVIDSISFSLPIAGNASQRPYWDGTNTSAKRPRVSVHPLGDSRNQFNTAPEPFDPGGSNLANFDIRGLNPNPTTVGAVPTYTNEGEHQWTNPNPNGDIYFSFADTVPFGTDRFRTFTIHFQNDSFEAPVNPLDPSTHEFVLFGASLNQLNPPAIPGGQNDGDAFGQGAVQVSISFRNTLTNQVTTCNTVFVDDGINDDRSIATCVGSGASRLFGVRAQASVEVPSMFNQLFGIPVGPYPINAKSDAMYNCQQGGPRLVHIDTFLCP